MKRNNFLRIWVPVITTRCKNASIYLNPATILIVYWCNANSLVVFFYEFRNWYISSIKKRVHFSYYLHFQILHFTNASFVCIRNMYSVRLTAISSFYSILHRSPSFWISLTIFSYQSKSICTLSDFSVTISNSQS